MNEPIKWRRLDFDTDADAEKCLAIHATKRMVTRHFKVDIIRAKLAAGFGLELPDINNLIKLVKKDKV